MSSLNLLREFADAVNPMTGTTDAYLTKMLGIPRETLTGGASLVGVTKAQFHSDGFYKPDPKGQPALIVPNGRRGNLGYEWDDISDRIAFRPGEPNLWYSRLRSSAILNSPALELATKNNDLLPVFSTPLAWLQYCGQGVCILDWEQDLAFHFQDVRFVVCDSHSTAARLMSALEDLNRCPEMHVLKPVEVSHAA